MNSFWLIEDYIFANDFLRFFDRSFQKNVKSRVFLMWKNVKYVFSNELAVQFVSFHFCRCVHALTLERPAYLSKDLWNTEVIKRFSSIFISHTVRFSLFHKYLSTFIFLYSMLFSTVTMMTMTTIITRIKVIW